MAVAKGIFSGKNNPFYGKHHTKDSIEKQKKSREWYAGSDEAKRAGKKISKALKGRPKPPRTTEHCKNMSIAKMGSIPWNKGLLGYGKGHVVTEATREKHRLARMKQKFPQKDNKLEKQFQLLLAINNIKFETHKEIFGQPDIFIEPNICIFVDGCYWHCCQQCDRNTKPILEQIRQIQRDATVIHELSMQGYIVLRIWEHEIRKNRKHVSQNIINTIKERMEQYG